MANLSFYNRLLGVETLAQLEDAFCGTLIDTNYTYSYFVDWEKVKRYRDKYRYELALLSTLKGASNPKKQLRSLLKKYPEVVKALPTLLAWRHPRVRVLQALRSPYRSVVYDFSKSRYTADEVRGILEFCEHTGLIQALVEMESTIDYATGVEVGLDTNARKNRSGDFMEKAVDEVTSQVAKDNTEIVRIQQKTFAALRQLTGIEVPESLRERKFDEVVLCDKRGINIEVNVYGGTGSKPSEIVGAYIDRRNELRTKDWRFIWVTDGDGWHQMRNSLRNGLEHLDYVFNLNMLEKGLLEEAIREECRE